MFTFLFFRVVSDFLNIVFFLESYNVAEQKSYMFP